MERPEKKDCSWEMYGIKMTDYADYTDNRILKLEAKLKQVDEKFQSIREVAAIQTATIKELQKII